MGANIHEKIRRPKCGRGGSMDQREYIAQLNIQHYRRKLGAEKDEATRITIMRLLAEDEAKLAAVNLPAR